MRATIDQGGRVVVPKEIRERLGLTAGAEVELSEVDGRLEVSPIPTPMQLEEVEGELVAVADVDVPTLTSDVVRAVIESTRR
jgi:AbrB family looped-hinge helix DNA binding protein